MNKTLQAQFTGVAIVLIDVSLQLTKLFFSFRSFRKHRRARKKEKINVPLRWRSINPPRFF